MSRPMPPYPRPAGGRIVSAAERVRIAHEEARPTLKVPTFLTIEEVAARLRVSKMTIYRLYHGGMLDGAIRVGRGIRVPEDAVRSLLRAGTDVRGAIEALRATPVND